MTVWKEVWSNFISWVENAKVVKVITLIEQIMFKKLNSSNKKRAKILVIKKTNKKNEHNLYV